MTKQATISKKYKLEDYESLIREVTSAGGKFRIYPKGVSMLPLVRGKKDSVILTAPDKPVVGDIILYRRVSGYALHRIVDKDENGFVCCGDNQNFNEYGIAPEQIIAKVAAIYRGKYRISNDNILYRVYTKIMIWRVRVRGLAKRLKHFFAPKREAT